MTRLLLGVVLGTLFGLALSSLRPVDCADARAEAAVAVREAERVQRQFNACRELVTECRQIMEVRRGR
jgi:hypothetical protein